MFLLSGMIVQCSLGSKLKSILTLDLRPRRSRSHNIALVTSQRQLRSGLVLSVRRVVISFSGKPLQGFCINVPYYKGKKRRQPFFPGKSLFISNFVGF